jgi:hypothetical protein
MKILFLYSMMVFLACSGTKKANKPEEESPLIFGNAPTYIYKTKGDYNQNIPVVLSADKKTIVSYPDPKDVGNNGKLATPTPLTDGYLLDNRGITPDVAFLKYTYEEYSQLKSVPSLNDLYAMIIDKDPLTELCDCGSRYQFKDPEAFDNLVKEKFKRCKRIK